MLVHDDLSGVLNLLDHSQGVAGASLGSSHVSKDSVESSHCVRDRCLLDASVNLHHLDGVC